MPHTPAGEELLEPVDAEACLRLLKAARVGRLALVADGRPRIVVLHHVEDGGDVLFRTRPDSLAARLTDGDAEAPAVYEVDSDFPASRSGWSVIATGVLVRESDPERVSRATAAIEPWARGERDLVLRLAVEELTGRRVGPPEE